MTPYIKCRHLEQPCFARNACKQCTLLNSQPGKVCKFQKPNREYTNGTHYPYIYRDILRTQLIKERNEEK